MLAPNRMRKEMPVRGDGFAMSSASLDQVAGQLAHGAQRLESAPAAPGDVQAGEITEAVTALVAHLSGQTEQFAGQLGGAGQAVVSSREVYETAEEEITEALEHESD